jgi:uncharacterized protein
VRLSRFVAVYRDAAPGEHVLYDVVGDRYVGVDDAMLAALAAPGDGQGEAVGAETDAQAALREMGFLVAGDADDERRLAKHWRAASEGMPDTLYVTLLPTLACNLACTYCVQKDHPATGRMSVETEAAAVAFVLRKVDESGVGRLLVHYIGGEPLTRKDLVLRTAEALSRAMAERGGTFAWEMTTNGVGLEAAFVNSLLAFGEGTVKLTLDGDRETHDAGRVYRSGKGTFDLVFGALLSVARGCPGLKLRVGGNFLPGQAESYERLLRRMEEAGLRGLVDEMAFKPVIDVGKGSGCSGCAAAPGGEAETLVQIGRSVQARGLARRSEGAVDRAGLCEVHWKNSCVIDPSGYLYKCFDVAGRPEMALGDVWRGETRRDPLTEARPWERHAPCRTCAYLPVCGGGCIGGRYLQTGRTGEVLCRIEHFEKTFREEIVARYLAEFHGGSETKRAA